MTGGSQFSYEQIRDIMTIYSDDNCKTEVEAILKDAPKDVIEAIAKIGMCITAADGVITDKEEATIDALLK